MKESEYRLVYLEEIAEPENGAAPALRAVALAYDTENGTARGLEESEAPADFEDFIEIVREDMSDLGELMIDDILKNGQSATSDYMNVLADLRKQPIDVVANMLAAILIDCAESAGENVVDQAEQITE